MFEDDFLFPKVGYVNSLEGIFLFFPITFNKSKGDRLVFCFLVLLWRALCLASVILRFCRGELLRFAMFFDGPIRVKIKVNLLTFQ